MRKFLVSLKKNPQIVPIVALCAAFLEYSLNLTEISNTTAKIQGQNMGLAAFVTMLFMMLSFVCMLNAFPRRKSAMRKAQLHLFLTPATILSAAW